MGGKCGMRWGAILPADRMPFPDAHPSLLRALAERGYAEPTPVQAAVLARDAAGRDLLVSAQTGSGKTVAFGLADGARRCWARRSGSSAAGAPAGAGGRPDARAGAAGRARAGLALRADRRPRRRLRRRHGHPPRAARAGRRAPTSSSARPAACATISSAATSTSRRCKVVVLDEADEMLDLGFREDLEFILDATPGRAAHAAVLGHHPQGDRRARQALPARRAAHRHHRRARGRTATSSTARVRIAPNEREHAVVNVLRYFEAPGALVFCATREAVRHLHASLRRARLRRRGAVRRADPEASAPTRCRRCATAAPGSASPPTSPRAASTCPTSASSIHADLPNDREALLHRSGRTGRAGRKGVSVLIVPYTRRRRAEQLLHRGQPARRLVAAALGRGDPRQGPASGCWPSSRLPTELPPDELAAASALLAGARPRRSPPPCSAATAPGCPSRRSCSTAAAASRAPAARATSAAARARPARRRRGLVPHERRPRPQRRSALADPADLPPRATSPRRRSARSASPTARPGSRSPATSPSGSRSWPRRPDAEDASVRIEPLRAGRPEPSIRRRQPPLPPGPA